MPEINQDLRFSEPLEKFLKLLPPQGVLLEIESGQALYSKIFANLGYSLINIEPPYTAFKTDNPYALDTHYKDICDTLVAYRSLCGVWAHEILSKRKREDCLKALDRFHEWLLPNGILYFCMPEGEGDKAISIQSVRGMINITQSYYTAEELVQMMEYADFEVLDAWREISGDRSLLHILAKRAS